MSHAPAQTATAVKLRPCRGLGGAGATLRVAVACVIISGAGCARPGQSASAPASEEASARTAGEAAPYARFHFLADGLSWDLGQGEYLVVLLSDSCDECRESVAMLNAVAVSEGCPPLVGLVLGEDPDLEDFRRFTAPAFPLHCVDAAAFFPLIGESPPRLVHVRDGFGLRVWDAPWPEPAELARALGTTQAQGER